VGEAPAPKCMGITCIGPFTSLFQSFRRAFCKSAPVERPPSGSVGFQRRGHVGAGEVTMWRQIVSFEKNSEWP
jgi:hypothetical protein